MKANRFKPLTAPFSFALSRGIGALYRVCLKAVNSKNRVKQPRADSGISETKRRAPALVGGVFYARNVAEPPITFLWGLLTGSRKACRFLFDGYSTPVSDPRPSSGIESGILGNQKGGHYHGKNSAYPHSRIHPHYPAHLFSPHNCGAGARLCLIGGVSWKK